MVGFDLETTAAEPEDARIVSAAVVLIGPRVEGLERTVEKFTWLVNPGVEIPQEAIDVHGITNERARADGDAPELVLPQIVYALTDARDNGWPIVMHNARYDFTVADRELRRRGYVANGADVLPELLVVDPIVIERHLDRYRPKRVASHSLEDCCRIWNVPLEGVTHDAAFDAIAACRLAWRLAVNGKVKRRTRNPDERREFIELSQDWESVRGDLGRLQSWQRQIAAAEAERLEAYFRAGDPSKDVPAQPDRVCPREWPIIPWRTASDAQELIASEQADPGSVPSTEGVRPALSAQGVLVGDAPDE